MHSEPTSCCVCWFSLKTSWLKWNPDHAGAAHAFDKAGMPCLCILHMQHNTRTHSTYKQPFGAIGYTTVAWCVHVSWSFGVLSPQHYATVMPRLMTSPERLMRELQRLTVRTQRIPINALCVCTCMDRLHFLKV